MKYASDRDRILVCDRCGISVMSRPLMTMANSERLCPKCRRCEYFDDADSRRPMPGTEQCPNPPVAFVEPKPAGQFYPALLCLEHVYVHIADHEFHLGSEWSIVAVSTDAARALAAHS